MKFAKNCVCKQVDLTAASSEDEKESYISEVEMLKRLQTVKGSNRIIRCYDDEIVLERGREMLYVVMERGDSDLSDVLRRISKEASSANAQRVRKSPLNNVQRRFYWQEMLEAVQAVHAAGVIHSDLKPANFVVVGGAIKLIDFGIASKLNTDQTSIVKESALGTLNYMSPEAISRLKTHV